MPCLPTVSGKVLELPASALTVHQVRRISRTRIVRWFALLGMVAPAVSSLPAATFVWDGNPPFGNGNSRWDNNSNWAGNSAPQANNPRGLTNSDIVFTGSRKTSPLLRNDYYVHSVTFAAGAASFQITPQATEVLYLGAGGITNLSTSLQRINATLSLRADQTWNAAAGNLAINSLLDLNDNTLTIAGNFTTTINNRIRDTGALIKEGAGNLILGGTVANTFSGGFAINAGTVTVAKAGALGTGALTLNGGVLDLGNFNLTVSSIALAGGTINSAAGTISSSADYDLQAGTVASQLAGTGGLNKTGSGVVTLTAANTYTGGTEIMGGRLVVNNLTGSGTGSGPVLVGSGGLLTGIGSISGLVTNGPGGSISAGDEIGTLALGPTVWFGGATNRWDLANATGTAGAGWDLLSINGMLTLAATAANPAIIDIVSFGLNGQPGLAANFDPTQNYLWTIVETTGGIQFLPGENENTIFDLLTGNFANPIEGSFGVALSSDGRSLNVFYSAAVPVPEPNQLVLVGLGFCGLVYFRRFKQNWA